jgi:hypothetical protein
MMVKDELRTVKYSGSEWKRTRGVMARSFYKELRDNGLTNQQVIELSTQLLQLVSTDIESAPTNR